RYFNKGDMAVIGRAAAVANIFGFRVSGLLAWLIWLFVHLIYIVEFQSRVVVFIQWGFEYLTFSRGARLITGVDVEDSVARGAPFCSGPGTQNQPPLKPGPFGQSGWLPKPPQPRSKKAAFCGTPNSACR